MKSMILEEYGINAAFQLKDIPKPTIKAGHVLVKIKATSVNTVDTMIHDMGTELPLSPELPAVLGMDFAGIIEAVGEGVTQFKVGDEVYGCAGGLADLQSTLAEYMLADANLIAHKPTTLTMCEAAALPLVGITAYEGLQRAGVKPEHKVLVHGGTGGVGHVAVQLAKYFGADVYATISGNDSQDIIQNYRATPIDYKTMNVEDYVNRYTDGVGFDVIFDSVGGENMTNSFAASALNGHVTTTVSMLEIDLTPAHFKGLSLHVVFMLIPMLYNHKREQHGKILNTLAQIVDEGALTPLLDNNSFNFENVGAAYNHLTSGQAVGKVVVSI